MNTPARANSKGFVIALLLSVAAGMKFEWIRHNDIVSEMRTSHIAHQSSNDGYIHVAWQESYSGERRFRYSQIDTKGSMDIKHRIYENNKTRGFESIALQVSDSGKHVLAAFFMCYNGPLLFELNRPPADCAQLYFIESVDGGNTWTKPLQISDGKDFIPAQSSIALLLEKDTERVYLFHAVKLREDGLFGNRIRVYIREPEDKSFNLVTTLPKIERLVSFEAAFTVDERTATHYTHLFCYADATLHRYHSTDSGKTWNFTAVASGATPFLHNFVAADVRAAQASFYALFRDKSAQKSYVHWTSDNGKTLENMIQTGVSPKPLRDTIVMCGSEKLEEKIVVATHIDYDLQNSYVRVLLPDANNFVDVPRPYNKVEGTPMVNLMVGCGYKGTRRFYITFAFLTRGMKDRIYFASGTLDLATK